MPLSKRRVNIINKIRQSIGQDRIPIARRLNNIWWCQPDIHAKEFPKLNVYPRLYPKTFKFDYFARFINQPHQNKNLFEFTHALPFRGVGCFLSKNDETKDEAIEELKRDWVKNPVEREINEEVSNAGVGPGQSQAMKLPFMIFLISISWQRT